MGVIRYKMNKIFRVEKGNKPNDGTTIGYTGLMSNLGPVYSIFDDNRDARRYIKSFLRKDWPHESGDVTLETYLNNFIDYMENITLEEMKDIQENRPKEVVKEIESRFEILDL